MLLNLLMKKEIVLFKEKMKEIKLKFLVSLFKLLELFMEKKKKLMFI
jgi:hypothetical protein